MKIEPAILKKAKLFLDNPEATLSRTLGFQFLEITRDRVRASMPVDERTVQPVRILHGGASAALAETLTSLGAWLNLDDEKKPVGVEINANHIKSVMEGSIVIGTATPIHKGKQLHVWESRITTEEGELVSIARCTIAILDDRPPRS